VASARKFMRLDICVITFHAIIGVSDWSFATLMFFKQEKRDCISIRTQGLRATGCNVAEWMQLAESSDQ